MKWSKSGTNLEHRAHTRARHEIAKEDKPISVNSVIKAALRKEWLKCSVKLSQNDVNFAVAAICIVLSIFPRVNCGKNNTRGGMFAFVSGGWFIPATILYPWRKDRRERLPSERFLADAGRVILIHQGDFSDIFICYGTVGGRRVNARTRETTRQ